jgi:ribonuclease T2
MSRCYFGIFHRAAVAAVAGLMVSACGPDNNAETKSADKPAQEGAATFDFYVLALSWSPSYCKTAGPKADNRQCGAQAHFNFIVHGLWPQYERGYPENCSSTQPKSVPEALARRYEDLTPSTGLIRHEWQKHGTCSGLEQKAYFEKLRAARERVTVPPAFDHVDRNRQFSPQAIEDAFVKANKGMPGDGIAVTCDRRYLREVRICLTRDLEFRSCKEVDSDSCGINSVSVPTPG